MKTQDFLILPLHRREGQDLDYLPGFHFAQASRGASRSRGGDRLLLHVSLEGALSLSDIQLKELLVDMAQGYFKSSGAATSGIKEQAERLNAFLLEKNRELPSEAGKSTALLTVLLMRSKSMILAQSGPVHGFLLSQAGIEHYFDPENAGRGLGLAQQTQIRFYHLDLKNDDIFISLAKLPEGWNEKTLQNVHGQKLATLRRRFLGDAGADLSAMMLAVREGHGEIKILGTSQQIEDQESQPLDPKDDRSTLDQFLSKPLGEAKPSSSAWENLDVPDEASVDHEITSPEEQDNPIDNALPDMAARPNQEKRAISNIGRQARNILNQSLATVQKWLAKLLPADGDFNLPSSTMTWIAALVPVLVVLMVSILYFRVGRGQLYNNYIVRAQASAAVASAIDDPLEARNSWELALQYAQKAASYDENEEVDSILLQAQYALDDMDSIERLDFQLALFNDLPEDVKIKHMLATNTELFMLDGNEGNVLRAFLTGGGYQLDDQFQCGPGPYGGFIVGAIIDIALLPSNNPQQASIVAMDANGNLVYCIVDDRPIAKVLEVPDNNWGNPIAIAIENENLHILDPLTNAVWLYFGEEFAFVEAPRFFFGADVPSMQQAIDFDLQANDLYILNIDGEIALCRFNNDIESPTTCEDPAEYQDSRPGHKDGSQIEGAHFLQLQVTDPPEPSVYLFDPIAHSVYQFSLRLNLVRQYKPQNSLDEGVASAFAINPNRAIFLAFDNQLYIAFFP